MRYAIALLLAVAGLAVAGSAAASPGVVKPVTLTIYVGKHGAVGGPKKFTVRKNARVLLVVHSTIGKSVHLHGYDIEKPIRSKTVPVRIPFVARQAGQFEVEVHITESLGIRIALLTVK
jgi:hypothetical protein